MASPSLKIKLRLSGPKQTDSQPASPALVVKTPTKDEDTPPVESPRKRAKAGSGSSRNRRSKTTEGTPLSDT